MKNHIITLYVLFLFFQISINAQSVIAAFGESMPHGENPVPSGDYTKRVLNTDLTEGEDQTWVVLENGGLKFLKRGMYFINATAPAFMVGGHRLFLRDVGNNIILTGTSEDANYDNRGYSKSQLIGIIKAARDDVFYLSHYAQHIPTIEQPRPSFGVESDDPEVLHQELYTQIWIYKIK